jgi:FHS family L-fucose permease-like MFS transporter
MNDLAKDQNRTTVAFIAVTTLFFAWGFITSMNDPLIPAVRAIFSLSYTESLLTQFAFFIAYGVMSIPGGGLVAKLGYTQAIVLALIAMIVGCLCMPLATHVESYAIVLVAMFIIASGMTVLQVAANPLSAALGPVDRSHFRLTLSQAFNSLGTVFGPWLGSMIMLRGGLFTEGQAVDVTVQRNESLASIDLAYGLMAALLALLTLFVWNMRGRIAAAAVSSGAPSSLMAALRSKWAVLGAVAIFFYVGAEVSIASVMINFLNQPDMLNVSHEQAGKYLSWFYWGGAMVGRFAGSYLLMRIAAPKLLSGAATVAALLCLVVSQQSGMVAAVAALSIGLFNSIMFPVIFTVTLERSTASAESTSGLLCMAIVGGALLPPLVGLAADQAGLHWSFLIPMVAYAIIAAVAAGAATVRRSSLASPPVIH